MQKCNATLTSKRVHGTLEPDTLLVNTLRDRVRVLGEMILQITDTALSEAEAFSREICSSTNKNAYMPLNNRVQRNVLNTVVKSSRESGKIVVSVSIFNTRESGPPASSGRRTAEQIPSRPPSSRLKQKSFSSLKASTVQALESGEPSSIGIRQASRTDDKPWRQKATGPRSARLKMAENRLDSTARSATKLQLEGVATVGRKGIIWDEEGIAQFLKDKPTAGDYQELIGRHKTSKTKSRFHTNESTSKPTRSFDQSTHNGVSPACELVQCSAPVYDKSYKAYMGSTPNQVNNQDNPDGEGATFFSSGRTSIERNQKASQKRQKQSGGKGKNGLCMSAAETLSGVYHLPGAILTQEAISDAEVEAVLLMLGQNTERVALMSDSGSHPRAWSLSIHHDPTSANSPPPRTPQKEVPTVHLASAPNPCGFKESESVLAASSFGRELSPAGVKILPVVPTDPCSAQSPSGAKYHSPDDVKASEKL